MHWSRDREREITYVGIFKHPNWTPMSLRNTRSLHSNSNNKSCLLSEANYHLRRGKYYTIKGHELRIVLGMLEHSADVLGI